MANSKKRPVKRLLNIYEPGEGKAGIIVRPKDINHAIFVASKGSLGPRNVAILMILFYSGLRITEVGKLTVSDVYYLNGSLKEAFVIPGIYTKTGKSRVAYLLAKPIIESFTLWKKQRLSEKAMISDGSFGGLQGDSPFFLSKKGLSWRKFSFNTKTYKTKNGIQETLVCSSLENLVRDLLKSAGFQACSSHTGRRSLATMMDRKGYDLELIQRILGHESPEMTLEYIDPWIERIDIAYKSICTGIKTPIYNDGF